MGAELGFTQAAACQLEPVIPEPPLALAPVNPFAFHVDLAPGLPLARIASPTHAVVVAKDPQRRRWAVDLAQGVAVADGDFILEWAPGVGRAPRAIHFIEEVDGERYALLMVMPPDDGEAVADRLPRETIFVVDSSGSMQDESIEQARAAAVVIGAAAGQSQLQVDGMALSDLAAVAGSPSYYDFDAFEEVRVETGGADVTLETAGARLKLLHPRGTNEWRGSAFALWSDGRGLAAERNVEAEAADGGTLPGNRLDGLRVADGELGGPLSRDHAWIWASAGRSELDRVALGGQAEEAVRESGVAKLNAQLGRDTSVVTVWSRGDTSGSGLGAGPDRAPLPAPLLPADRPPGGRHRLRPAHRPSRHLPHSRRHHPRRPAR